MATNIDWHQVGGGDVDNKPDLVVPGDTAGEQRCGPQEWGISVGNVVVYGSLGALRDFLEDALSLLPAERNGSPLVLVDAGKQRDWLNQPGILYDEGDNDPDGEPWTATVESVRELLDRLEHDPAAAGWTLQHGVDGIWADCDEDTGDLVCGAKLASRLEVGIGEPLTDEDFAPQRSTTDIELAEHALTVVAIRINGSYDV